MHVLLLLALISLARTSSNDPIELPGPTFHLPGYAISSGAWRIDANVSRSENDNVVILSPGGRAGSTALLQLLQTRPEFKVIREALRRARSLQALKTTLDNAFAGAIGQRVVLSIKFEQHVPSGMSLVQLLELLRDKYGFRHYILLQRSPVRTAISMRAGEKFGWMKRVTGRCDRYKRLTGALVPHNSRRLK